MIPVERLTDADRIQFGSRCRDYLSSLNWITEINDLNLAYGIGGIIGIFLAKVSTSYPDIPNYHWIIIGDLPPAYIDFEENSDWKAALDAYITEMSLWVEAVRADKPLDDIIPVTATPTLEHADMLESRLQFLQENLLLSEPPQMQAQQGAAANP
jgi:hypothetical protein